MTGENPFLAGNYAPVQDELVADDLPMTGALPAGLQGTLYRNGPNPHHPPVAPYHWFTGDGMVHAIRIDGGRAGYRNRWVRTPRFLAEAAAGQALLTGFGQPLTDHAADLDTGVANTHVLAHAGRLLALEEAHLPTRLDPQDLSTIDVENFGGAVSGRFTAHPKRDPVTGQLVFFSYSATGPFSPGMTWGVIEADGRVSRCETFEAPYCSMVHDFAVTATHVVFPVLPLTGDLDRAMTGGPPFAWEPGRPGFLGVMRRDAGAASLRWIETDARFAFHVMNAFDHRDGVAMDVVEYSSAPLFPHADGSPPGEVHACLARWQAGPHSPFRREVLDDHGGEFPRIDERRAGLPYRYGFRIGAGGEAIIRHDLEQRTRSEFALGSGERASEAVFVPSGPKAAEGEGWLLSVVWQAAQERSVLMVLDAQALADGPVATVALPRRVPFGFHGSWMPATPPRPAHR